MKRAALAALLLLPVAADAAVYKCSVDGHLTFQDHACARDSELLIVQPQQPVNGSEPPSTSTAEWLQQADKDSKQRQIDSLERQNRQLQTEMGRAVDAVQKQTPTYYGEDPDAKTEAVKRDFGARIQANQSKIEALRKGVEGR